MNILCRIGLHQWHVSTKYLPNIYAEIVTDFIQHCECQRCGKVKYHDHLVWYNEEMIDFEVWRELKWKQQQQANREQSGFH